MDHHEPSKSKKAGKTAKQSTKQSNKQSSGFSGEDLLDEFIVRLKRGEISGVNAAMATVELLRQLISRQYKLINQLSIESFDHPADVVHVLLS